MVREILTDEDVDRLLSMADAVAITEEIFRYHAEGTLLFEPRFSFETKLGSLKFTAGAAEERLIIGSRVSGKFPADPGRSVDFEVETPVKADMCVVFDIDGGEPVGAVRGTRLADVRTGAIGGVGIDRMAPGEVSDLGVIGTGRMAWTQTEAATAVRTFDSIRAYSRSPPNRDSFASAMSEHLGQEVRAVDSAEAVVRGADVLVTGTTSPEPVFDLDWLEPGVHINVIGPMFHDAHEVDPGLFDLAGAIATDSLEQIDAYGDRYLLAGTPHREAMIELKDLVAGTDQVPTARDEMTVCCPIGLPGTEVVLAHELLSRADRELNS